MRTIPLPVRVPHFNLKTSYQYDLWGNTVKLTDPKGNETLTTYNALGQMVRRQSPTVTTPAGPVRYETRFAYDANDNLVQTDVLNVNDQGVTQANAWFTTTRTYDSSGKHAQPHRGSRRRQNRDENLSIRRFGQSDRGTVWGGHQWQPTPKYGDLPLRCPESPV